VNNAGEQSECLRQWHAHRRAEKERLGLKGDVGSLLKRLPRGVRREGWKVLTEYQVRRVSYFYQKMLEGREDLLPDARSAVTEMLEAIAAEMDT